MKTRRFAPAVLALVILAGGWAPRSAGGLAPGLPSRLSDAEFWKLIQDFSEPDGFFPSQNLVSNEDTFQVVVPELQRVVKPGGVYIGVGPDQNFTYIAAVRPGIVFLPDVRRGNTHMQLMYKALMELSPDRAGFVSRLFSRKQPEGLKASAGPAELFGAFGAVEPARAMFDQTFEAILATLGKRGYEPGEADVRGIEYIFRSFFSAGPFLSYSSAPATSRSRYPSFEELQRQTDAAGVARGYLASEENYRVVRDLQQRNLIVPMVANFAGPKTLRAIGAWAREREARVTTFYASNVEQYLFQDGIWDAFAENLAALPTDTSGTFIRSCFNVCVSATFNSRVVMLLDSIPALVRDHKAGVIRGYHDVLSRQR